MSAGGRKLDRRKQFVDGGECAPADHRQSALKFFANAREAKFQRFRHHDGFGRGCDIDHGAIDVEKQRIAVEIEDGKAPIARCVGQASAHQAVRTIGRRRLRFTTPFFLFALVAWSRLRAEFTKATCENACGKLPNIRFSRGLYSSASRPTSLRSFSSRS